MKPTIRQLLSASFVLAAWLISSAGIPPGYYSSLQGKTEARLKAAVHDVIYPHTQVSSYSALPTYFEKTDVYPESNKWWDMYSNVSRYAPNFWGLHREHSFPKSWWGGSQDTPAYVDLMHLYPADGDANMAKSNYPLGTVATWTFNNGVSKVGYAVTGQGGGADKVFEPSDEYKGDFARTYFYMVTCYSNLTWNRSYMYMLQQNDYPTLTPWAVDLLLKWSREDPVSQKEIDRNEQVYLVQSNRNPFIDFPNLCEYIWGNKKGQPFDVSSPDISGGEPTLITPARGMALDFGEVAVGSTISARIHFTGANCTGNFSFLLSGTNRSLFTLDSQTVSASLVNSESGFWLNVTYTPTSAGTHKANLVVKDGGLVGSRTIQLIGTCYDVPVLTAINALPASDITPESYVVNWDIPANEVVDYYVITRTRYVNGFGSSEEVESDTSGLTLYGFEDSDYETYSVQSVRLGYRSPRSNVITVQHSSLDDIRQMQPLAVNSYAGCIRFIMGEPQKNCRIYDMAGRLVRLLPEIENDEEITLPRGVYFVTTDSHRTPLKAVSF